MKKLKVLVNSHISEVDRIEFINEKERRCWLTLALVG